MAVRSTLALKLGAKLQVQFQTNPSGVTAVVRNRKDDCFGLEFLPQLSSGDRTLNQSKFVCNPAGGGTPESQTLARHSCNPKTLLAGLRRKQLEIKQVQKEIAALIGAFSASLAAIEGGQLRDGTWKGVIGTSRYRAQRVR